MPEIKSPLPGVNVCLMGPTGTGKTHAIGTLVDYSPDLQVHHFAFGETTESLIGYWTDRGKPVPPNLHTFTIKPGQASWLEMADQVKMVGTISYEALKKSADPHRSKYNQLEQFLRTFNDVREDGSDKKFGAVDNWGTGHVLVIDSLSGLGEAAKRVCVGGKFDMDQKDWGLAQNMVEGMIRRLTSDCRCHFVLLSHIERETDQVLGGSKITLSTLGAKLAPKLPPMFSDVVLTTRNVDKFRWDTANPQADLKTRNLAISGDLQPNFATIFDKWKSRGGVLEAT